MNPNGTSTNPLTRLMQHAPMLRIAAGFMVGILLAEHLPPAPQGLLWSALAISILAMLAGTIGHRRAARHLFSPALWAAMLLAGYLSAQLHSPADPFGIEPGRTTFVVRLTDTPHPSARSLRVPAEVEAYADSTGWHTTRGRIMLFFQPSVRADSLRYGQCLYLRATPSRPSGEQNPHQFDYNRYLRHKGILWQCYADSSAFLPAPHAASAKGIKAWSKSLQLHLVNRLRHTSLTPSQQGIAEALLLGWRDDIDPDTQRQFRNAGITHLLCVSGLHVGIIAWLAGLLFLPLGMRRWARTLRGGLQMAVIWLFVLITGMAPSTLRAGVMFSLLLLCNMGAQRSSGINNLCTSALLLLLARPALLFDVGFQLSYSAVLGIMALFRPLERLLPIPDHTLSWWLPRKTWHFICLTTAAQLGTFPFVLFYFHQFPTFFLIANLLVVPFATLLLATVLAVVFTGTFPALCDAVTSLLRLELVGIDTLTRWIGNLPHAMLTNLYCDLPMTLLIAAALLTAAYGLHTHRHWTLPATLALLLATGLYTASVDLRAGRQQSVIVYAAGRHWAAEYLCGHESYLFADSTVTADPSLIAYQRDNLLLYRRIRHTIPLPVGTHWSNPSCAVSGHAAQFGKLSLILIDTTNARPFSRHAPLPSPVGKPRCNILLVAPDCRCDSLHLAAAFSFDTLIHRPAQALFLTK